MGKEEEFSVCFGHIKFEVPLRFKWKCPICTPGHCMVTEVGGRGQTEERVVLSICCVLATLRDPGCRR